MWLLLSFLAVSALPNVWLTDHVCGTKTMAQAFHILRPNLELQREGHENKDDLHVSLEKVRELFVVKVRRGQSVVIRSFADPGDCEVAAQTAALIADGALDDLPPATSTVTLEKPAPPPIRTPGWISSPSIGIGGRQTMLGAAASLMLGFKAAQELFESEFIFEVALPNSQPLLRRHAEEFGLGPQDAYTSVSFTPILLEGVGFAVGPGRLSFQAEVGVELTILEVKSQVIRPERFTNPVSEPFGGLRVGYTWNLTDRLFLAASVDERIAPASTRIEVIGIPSHVTNRNWTLSGTLSFGMHFL